MGFKKSNKSLLQNDPDWRDLLCPSPPPGNWELGERVGMEKSMYFCTESEFLLPANRGVKAAGQTILRNLSKRVGRRVLPRCPAAELVHRAGEERGCVLEGDPL